MSANDQVQNKCWRKDNTKRVYLNIQFLDNDFLFSKQNVGYHSVITNGLLINNLRAWTLLNPNQFDSSYSEAKKPDLLIWFREHIMV